MNLQDHFDTLRKVADQNAAAAKEQNEQTDRANLACELHEKIFKIIRVRIFVEAKLPIIAHTKYDRLDLTISNTVTASHLKCTWNPLPYSRFHHTKNHISFEFMSFEHLIRELTAQKEIFDKFKELLEDRPGKETGGIAPGKETVQSLKEKGEWK